MAKIQSFGYALCLLGSIAVNLLFSINLYVGWKQEGNHQQLSWTQKAAAEAEAVASVSCSGHGRAYLDGSLDLVDGRPVCECNTCYGGLDCSQLLSGCAVDADSGDPLFLEPFWMQHAASSAVLVAGWHRMSYRFDDLSMMSKELEKLIRKVHAVVGNAVTAGRYIVFGVGSSQLLNAAVYALAPDNSSSPSSVVASIPFYPLYKMQTDFFRTVDIEFQGDTSLWMNTTNNTMNVVEFVTSPNNPDGLLKKAVLGGSSVNAIHDHAYYWPHFTPIPSPADEDLMIFTLSKLTGHAGTRFGWAVIKDKAVYDRMINYIQMAELGISRDTQLRAFKLLKAVVEGDGKEIFKFAYQTMRDKWERLSEAFSTSKRFSVQQIPPQYCSFFQKVRGPSPAYVWVKCEREEDEDCNAVLLKEANVIGRAGSMFSAGDRYTRLSLLKSQDDFELLLHRITQLVSNEDIGVQTL